MDEYKRKKTSTRIDESLGLLNMENVKGFGEDSSTSRKSTVSEKLASERKKALKVIEQMDKVRNSSKQYSRTSTPLVNVNSVPSLKTPGLEKTDYVPYVAQNHINISDLVVNETINLNSARTATLHPSRDSKSLSFEPTEITGRSTLYKRDFPKTTSASPNNTMSLEEILATSISEKVRNLGKSIKESGGIASADLSQLSSLSSLDEGNFSFGNCHKIDSMSDENFAPIDKVQSILAAGEREWEMEYAVIPSAASGGKIEGQEEEATAETCSSNKCPSDLENSEFSIGSYFNKRSENLYNIISNGDSPKRHVPVPLIDDSSISSTSIGDNNLLKMNLTQTSKTSPSANERESNGETDVLSLSTIAKALDNIEIDESSSALLNRFLSNKLASLENSLDTTEQESSLASSKTLNISSNKTLEKSVKQNRTDRQKAENNNNKENIMPTVNIQLSETASFSESILNCSEIKQHEDKNKRPNESSKQNRSTLKPSDDNEKINKKSSDVSKKSLSKLSNNSLKIPQDSTSSKLSPSKGVSQKESRKRSHSSSQRPLSPNPLPPVVETIDLEKQLTQTQDRNRLSVSPSSSCSSNSSSSNQQSPSSSHHNSSSNSNRLVRVKSSSPDYRHLSLPSYGLVSRSSSTTSLDTKFAPNRCLSQCSTSSEYSHHPDGIMPLKATCTEVSWPSIKLRKCVTKSFRVKNVSMKRLALRMEICGPGFQIVNSEHGNFLTLQAQECRTIVLSFCPTVIGAAVGHLEFKPPDREISSHGPTINLYGYGGHVSIIPEGISKGPVGSAFLTMGELRDLSNPLVRSFILHNSGPLRGFAVVSIDSFGLDLPRLRDCVEVQPSSTIITPKGTVRFRVIFKPQREDMKKIIQKISQVMTLANLRIISGDEPTRQRIRNLIRKMNETQRADLSSSSLDRVWNAFPDENEIFELDTLREHAETAKELVSTLRVHEIALTLNHTVHDETATEDSLVFHDSEETILFKTIISNHPETEAAAAGQSKSHSNCSGSNSNLNRIEEKEDSPEAWSVRPNILEIDPFNKKKTTVLKIFNHFHSAQYFEVTSNFRHLFLFSPSEGNIPGGGSIDIIISHFLTFLISEQINIEIYMENGKITVPVNIINYPPHLR